MGSRGLLPFFSFSDYLQFIGESSSLFLFRKEGEVLLFWGDFEGGEKGEEDKLKSASGKNKFCHDTKNDGKPRKQGISRNCFLQISCKILCTQNNTCIKKTEIPDCGISVFFDVLFSEIPYLLQLLWFTGSASRHSFLFPCSHHRNWASSISSCCIGRK